MAPSTSIQRPELVDSKLSDNFWLSEFIDSQQATRLGIANIPSPEQLANLRRVAATLERVRRLLGSLQGDVPAIISSGYRSPQLNRAVGGSRNSAHLQGLAADFTAARYGTPLAICKAIACSDIAFDQLIWERTWVHLGLAPANTPPRQQVLTAHFGPAGVTYTKGLP